MSAKITQRRRQLDSKRSTSINNEQINGNPNVAAAAAAARRRNQHRHFPTNNRSRFEYLFRSLLKKKFSTSIPPYVTTILLGILMAFTCYKIFNTVMEYRNQYEYTNVPIKLPRLVQVNDTAPEINPQRFWGTYRFVRISERGIYECLFRSNLYFGIKHRSPRSLSGGLMWFDYGKLQQSQDRFLR